MYKLFIVLAIFALGLGAIFYYVGTNTADHKTTVQKQLEAEEKTGGR